MKKIIAGLLGIVMVCSLYGQSKKYDTLAILILDRMSDVIGGLTSCSFSLNAANDVVDRSGGLIKYFSEYEVFMSGPDKMMVNAHGHKGHRQFLYNGDQFAYYSFDENNYGILPAPGNIISMIDSMNAMYDIDFPAGDFFYPAFTDDLLQSSDSVRYQGIERSNGKEYFHVVAYSKEMLTQFWISNDSYDLPARFAITYRDKPGVPQYLAIFSNWQINPQLPDAMFDFLPPPGAAQVRMLSKKDR